MSTGIEIKKKTLLVNTLSGVVERILSLSILVWMTAYLVQHVPKADFEIYKAIAAIMLFMPLVAQAVAGGVARYITEAYARGDERRVTQIVSTMFPICAGTGATLLGVGLVLALNVDHVLNIRRPELVGDAKLMFAILVGVAALRVVLMPYLVGLIVRQKFLWIDVISLCQELMRIGLLFTLLFGVSIRVLWVPVALLPAVVISLSLQCVLSRRLVPSLRFRRSEVRRELVRPILSVGTWSLLSRSLAAGRQAAGLLILNRGSTAAQSVGWELGAMVEHKVFPSALKPLAAVQPVMTAMHATQQDDRFRDYYLRFCRYTLWGLLFLSAPLIAYADEVWALYIPDKIAEFAFAPLVMVLLLAKVVTLFPLPMLAQVALARDRMAGFAGRTAAVDGATIVACLAAVLLGHGAVGVAVAQLGVSVVLGPLCYWGFGLQLADAGFDRWMRHTVLPGMLPLFIAAPVYFGTPYLFAVDSWSLLACHVALGSLAFAGVVLLCCDATERADIRHVLSRILGGASAKPH